MHPPVCALLFVQQHTDQENVLAKKRPNSRQTTKADEAHAHVSGPVIRSQARVLQEAFEMTERDPEVLLKHVSGAESWAMLENAAEVSFDPRSLSLADVGAVEAMILHEGRPVLLIQNGEPQEAQSDLWRERIGDAEATIEGNISSVGRIEAKGHPLNSYFGSDDDVHIGTCSVVSPNTVLTNRHVAVGFCNPDGSLKHGMTACVDFVEEYGRDADIEFSVVRVIDIGHDFDFAVLEVQSNRTVPRALSLADAPIDESQHPLVYVIGYPAFDSRNPRDSQNRTFDGLYNVKRSAPSRLTSLQSDPPLVGHRQRDRRLVCDYTSLGGNSGSPLFDLENGNVIGLHFAGRYGEGNYSGSNKYCR